jgi:hypothetical protein
MIAQCCLSADALGLLDTSRVVLTEQVPVGDPPGEQGLVAFASTISVSRFLSCGSGCLHWRVQI